MFLIVRAPPRPGGSALWHFGRLQFTNAVSGSWLQAPCSVLWPLKDLVLKHFTPDKTSASLRLKSTGGSMPAYLVGQGGNVPITLQKASRDSRAKEISD